MDVLKITPPFFYSYQCGSTLLTSYIPVHMYSISLQILSSIGTFIVIFSSPNMAQLQYPSGCCLCLQESVGLHTGGGTPNSSIRLIESHQIISKTINNIILLLSFGLCSPVLCGYIAVSICIHLCGWLILIGRFVFVRIDALNVSRSSSHPIDRGS
jgi:hypothetical protein